MNTQHIDQMLEAAANAAEIIKAQLAGIRDEVHSDLLEGPDVTVYAQRTWSNILLGKSTKYSIGSSGCLLCSVCSALHDAGLNMDPPQFNAWMATHGGFIADDEGQIVKFVYAALNGLNVLKFDKIEFYPNRPPTPAPIAVMDAYLAAGGYIIIEVDFNPATTPINQHWCRYLGTTHLGGNIMDPWFGDIADVAKRYKPGLTAKEAIIAAAYYKRVGA